MTEMMVRPPAFSFPAPTKAVGGLLDLVHVTEGMGFMEPEGLAESYNTLRLDSVPVWPCPPGAPTTKDFNPSSWIDGIRFAVYGGVTCKGPGFDMAEAETKTRDAFLAMESVGVERALMTTRFIDGSEWDDVDDVTPAGGAATPAVALALLEGAIACNYAGAGIIHASRAVASLLTGVQGSVVREGDRLLTKLGTRVAAGGGYGCPNTGPSGAAPAAGVEWMFATGEIAVARSDVFSQAELDRATNDVYVLAERAYVAAVDGYVAAVQVKVA